MKCKYLLGICYESMYSNYGQVCLYIKSHCFYVFNVSLSCGIALTNIWDKSWELFVSLNTLQWLNVATSDAVDGMCVGELRMYRNT